MGFGLFDFRHKREVDIAERANKTKFLAFYLPPMIGLTIASAIFLPLKLVIFLFIFFVVLGIVAYNNINIFSFLGGSVYYSTGGSDYKQQFSMERALVKQEKYDQAIEMYRQELLKNPKDLRPQIEIADLLCDELEDFTEAIKEYRKAQQMNLSAEQHFYVSNRIIGIYSSELQNYDKAIGECKRVIRRYANSEEIKERMENIIGQLEEMKEEIESGEDRKYLE